MHERHPQVKCKCLSAMLTTTQVIQHALDCSIIIVFTCGILFTHFRNFFENYTSIYMH